MKVLAVVSHWDVDGIAAAAIARRMGARVVRLSSTTAIAKMIEESARMLEGADNPVILVADLNPNPIQARIVATAVDYASALGVQVVWVDHHVWDERALKLVAEAGARLYIDTGSVSADLVRRLLGCDDGVCERLTHMAYSDDNFTNDDPYAVRWRRILRWFDWRVRYRAVEAFARGTIWPAWAQKLWSRIRDEYEELIRRAVRVARIHTLNGVRVAVVKVPSERIHPGELHQAMVREGIEAEIYAMIYENGVSLRSSGIPLTCIARELGGGGHENAAGAPGYYSVESLLSALRNAIEKCVNTGRTTLRHNA